MKNLLGTIFAFGIFFFPGICAEEELSLTVIVGSMIGSAILSLLFFNWDKIFPKENHSIKSSTYKNYSKFGTILFIDVETTGLPTNWKASYKLESNWPRIVQIAWKIAAKGNQATSVKSYIIKPEGYTIPIESTKIHKISNEKALQNGVSIYDVLNNLYVDLLTVDTIVAHNLDFDLNVVACEFHRKSIEPILLNKIGICTMKKSTNFCKLPGRYGYKWPTLEELNTKLFGSRLYESHNAIQDVIALEKIFWGLANKNII
ncbi:MAG: 3'-5' exonuclease [Chitinophagales bacterium]|nr:3'-5' exonuclease [Chitinophagales bacterium]